MIVLRLLLRLIVVPFGALVAIWAAAVTAIIFHWSDFTRAAEAQAGTPDGALIVMFMVGPLFATQVMISALAILSPGAVAILIAEAFAIRSWMFHIPAGGLCAWIGSAMAQGMVAQGLERAHPFFEEPLLVAGAGLIAGAAYWAIAGWNAGFWKPVFPQPPAVAVPAGTPSAPPPPAATSTTASPTAVPPTAAPVAPATSPEAPAQAAQEPQEPQEPYGPQQPHAGPPSPSGEGPTRQ